LKNLKIKELPKMLALSTVAFVSIHSTCINAQENGIRESIFVSPVTTHYTYNPAHKPVWLIGFEQQLPDKSLRGSAFFSNSFGQESLYVFLWGGRYDDVLGVEGLHAKWTAGALYGYKAPYENKVPLNYKGFSPAIIPSIGYQINSAWSVDALFLGKAALMLGTSYRFK
jgi:hypothetical protein